MYWNSNISESLKLLRGFIFYLAGMNGKIEKVSMVDYDWDLGNEEGGENGLEEEFEGRIAVGGSVWRIIDD